LQRRESEGDAALEKIRERLAGHLSTISRLRERGQQAQDEDHDQYLQQGEAGLPGRGAAKFCDGIFHALLFVSGGFCSSIENRYRRLRSFSKNRHKKAGR